MPGQRPGECGRRIAGRDACPTQKGRHPPHRGVSAVPPAVAPLYFFAHIAPTRTAGRCDRNLSCFLFQPPLRSPRRRVGAPNTAGPEWVSRGRRTAGRLGELAQPPCEFFCAALEVSAVEAFPASATHENPDAAFQLFGGVRMPSSLPEGRTSPYKV